MFIIFIYIMWRIDLGYGLREDFLNYRGGFVINYFLFGVDGVGVDIRWTVSF